MNNKIVHGIVFGLLGCSGITFGMELQKLQQDNKGECFSLCIKKNGLFAIKKCTIDDAESKTIIRRDVGSIHNLVKTTPIHYKKIKTVQDINFSTLGSLLDKGEKFFLEVQAANQDKEKYLIDQVDVKRWPILFDEIRNGKWGSVGKYFSSDFVVDLHDSKPNNNNAAVLSCLNSEPYDYPLTETLGSIALIALLFFYWKKSPMAFAYVANSLK